MFSLDENKNLVMYEGDYGENIAIKLINNFITNSTIKFFITDDLHNPILEKECRKQEMPIKDVNCECNPCKNVDFYYVSLTEQESKKLKAGNYLFGIKQFKNNVLIETLIANKVFYVIKGC